MHEMHAFLARSRVATPHRPFQSNQERWKGCTRIASGRESSEEDIAWWKSRELLHVVVFDLDEPTEALLTVSTRHRGEEAPENAIVAFDAKEDALRCADTLKGRMMDANVSVEGCSPLALTFLCESIGCQCEVVPHGIPWSVPETLVDTRAWKDASERDVLSVSKRDLEAFLSDPMQEDASEEEEDAMSARKEAATRVRDVLARHLRLIPFLLRPPPETK